VRRPSATRSGDHDPPKFLRFDGVRLPAVIAPRFRSEHKVDFGFDEPPTWTLPSISMAGVLAEGTTE